MLYVVYYTIWSTKSLIVCYAKSFAEVQSSFNECIGYAYDSTVRIQNTCDQFVRYKISKINKLVHGLLKLKAYHFY